MPKKGKAKNTMNKAKHSKLIQQKKNKLPEEKRVHKLRLKELHVKRRKIENQKNDNAS